MKDLIQNVYFDKVRYILSNIPKLELSNDELVVILTILILQEKNSVVSVDTIVKETGMESKTVDDILTLLASKRYLEIKVVGTSVDVSVDNIFNLKQETDINTLDIFKIFEDEFSRTFNQKELVRLNKWMSEYSRDEIIDALRSASIMNKLDMNYINRILENNRNESK